jgi:hypothetical protein
MGTTALAAYALSVPRGLRQSCSRSRALDYVGLLEGCGGQEMCRLRAYPLHVMPVRVGQGGCGDARHDS